MNEVKAPASRNYLEYLVSSLKDSQEAAAYIAVMLELDEEGYDPKLMRSALKDVINARIQANNLSKTAKQHYEKLDKILAETGGAEIYALIEFLDALGYRIALTPKDDNSFLE